MILSKIAAKKAIDRDRERPKDFRRKIKRRVRERRTVQESESYRLRVEHDAGVFFCDFERSRDWTRVRRVRDVDRVAFAV